MGCDIHCIHQKLDEKTNTWVSIKELEMWRNYDLFSVLAGVRGCETPIVYPRGLPSDFKVVTKRNRGIVHKIKGIKEPVWMGEHSFSWLLLSELSKYHWVTKHRLIHLPEDLKLLLSNTKPKEKKLHRIVFGFDS